MMKLALKTSDQFRGAVERIQTRLKLQALGLFQFKAKVYFEIRHEDLLLRTACDFRDIEALTRFRYQQFFPEDSLISSFAVDADRFDRLADHLLIIDQLSKQIVGTYRLLFSDFTSRFYTESEFQISGFFELPGTKLELGRAAVHPNYRNGSAIQLLWRGIAKYIRSTGARWLFGCASLPTLDPFEAATVERALREEGLFRFDPHPSYRGPVISQDLVQDKSRDEIRRGLPPLFRTYLAAGAKVVGSPAFDHDFACVDFPIVLDMHNLNLAFQKKFMPADGSLGSH